MLGKNDAGGKKYLGRNKVKSANMVKVVGIECKYSWSLYDLINLTEK